MTKANLSGAYLTDADLTNADLTDADLTDAKLTQRQIATCKSLKGATMLNGQKYEEWLGTSDGQDWLKKYKKDLGEKKKARQEYEKCIQTTEGRMWVKAIRKDKHSPSTS